MKRLIAIVMMAMMTVTLFGQAPTFQEQVNAGTRVAVIQGNSITGDPTAKTGVCYLWNEDADEVGWGITAYTDVFDFEPVAGIPLRLGAGTVFPEEWDRVVPAAFANYEFQLYKWQNLTSAIVRLIPILDEDDLTFDIGVILGYDDDTVFGVGTSLSISF